ncbi:MAG: hypothetical protein ACFNUU_10445 [Campylobacter sp.]|uniref:hypothetical protein n=1 Tax=Campylobacter sp. TaxID=205 RepID=UPI00360A1DF3
MRFWAALAFGRVLQKRAVFGVRRGVARDVWRVNLDFTGRAYAVYGGVYIVSSLLWLHFVEKQAFTKWDLIGGAICLLGACAVLYGGRG